MQKPGDFVTRQVGGRNILFARDAKGTLRAMFNTCPHRGAQVCREKHGNAKSFQCFYHGWVFGLDGALRSQPGEASYAPDFEAQHLQHAAGAAVRDAFAISASSVSIENAEPLDGYLGAVKEYLDVIADQAEMGMTIVGGTQEYSMRANWKLLTENSIDGYHALTTRRDLLRLSEGHRWRPCAGAARGARHAISATDMRCWSTRRRGDARSPNGSRCGARTASARSTGSIEGLVARYGEERAERIALYNRNLFVFPNLVVNDIMAVTIRTYYPQAPDFMTVSAWALAPKEETDWARKYRLFNFLEFLGPGGFATPDDVEALEQCQRGFRNATEAQWNDISKGMGKETPAYDDELQMRAFWSNWNRHVFAASA